MNSIIEHADPNIIKVLVGTKKDLSHERIITESQAQSLADQHNMPYFETSAKNNENISELMEFLIRKVYDTIYKGKAVGDARPSVLLHKDKKHAKKEGGSECKC